MTREEAEKRLFSLNCMHNDFADEYFILLNKIYDDFEAKEKPKKKVVIRGDSNLVEMLKQHENINTKALMEWMDYKKYKSKGAVTKTLNMLNKYDHQTQQEMVDKSIMNEYKGLFEPKQQTQTQRTTSQIDTALDNNIYDMIDALDAQTTDDNQRMIK